MARRDDFFSMWNSWTIIIFCHVCFLLVGALVTRASRYIRTVPKISSYVRRQYVHREIWYYSFADLWQYLLYVLYCTVCTNLESREARRANKGTVNLITLVRLTINPLFLQKFDKQQKRKKTPNEHSRFRNTRRTQHLNQITLLRRYHKQTNNVEQFSPQSSFYTFRTTKYTSKRWKWWFVHCIEENE